MPLLDLTAVVPGPIGTVANHLLAAHWVNRTYADVQHHCHADPTTNFFSSCLHHIGIGYTTNADALLRIPETGPVLVVANHPFGGADAIILADILTRVRPADARFLANSLLDRVPEARPHIIPVDPFGGDSATRTNRAAMRDALTHLKSGGLLGVFPAGEVSSLSFPSLKIRDRPWSAHIGALAQKTGATVVPVHFAGTNSLTFQLSGLVHPLLRTAQLARQLQKKSRTSIRVRIGKALKPTHYPPDPTPQKLADFFRLRTDLLAETSRAEKSQTTRSGKKLGPADLEPVVPAVDPALLRADVDALPPETRTVQQDGWHVYIATANQLPNVLREIGRLREITFRAVGEGTGTPLDLDGFDPHYSHLFLWNDHTGEIAGAYRLALTDEIIRDHGPAGLYTASLFNFKPGFLPRLGPAIELGRSFVTSKYQRKLTSLFMLWKGVCRFVAANPKYHLLFGPVSISQDYHALSKSLLVRFLRQQFKDAPLAKYVTAPNPPAEPKLHHLHKDQVAASLGDIEHVGALISEIEQDGKSVPVLLRHYIKMSAVLLSFNIDHKFNGCIDGLVLVDFLETDPKLLKRYMGADGLQAFQSHHANTPPMPTRPL